MHTIEQSIVVIARQNSILDWFHNFGYKKEETQFNFVVTEACKKLLSKKESESNEQD